MSSSPTPRLEPLQVSSRYRVVRKLGSGTTGSVYLADDLERGSRVALKIIRVDRRDPEGTRALQREFRVLTGLRHPGIARAHDFGYTRTDGLPFFTRDYVEGEPLRPGPPGPVAPEEFLRPLLELLDALAYLHANEILHLDVHAGNVIEPHGGGRGSVLIDFGLTRMLEGSRSAILLRSGATLPPDFVGEESIGPVTDVYAAGKLLLQRVTGSASHDGRLPKEIPRWGPRLTLELERIIAKATQHDPARRFASAAEFRDVLAEAIGDRAARESVEPAELTVGRGAELDRIEETLRCAAAGQPRCLALHGPAGLGKSRLLEEARWSAQLRGLDVVEIRFPPRASRDSRLLDRLRSLSDARGESRQSRRWIDAMHASHGGSTRERAQRAARAFFESAGPPLVILLDDLELADRGSLVLAEALASEARDSDERSVARRGLALIAAVGGAIAAESSFRPSGPAALRLDALGRRSSARLPEKLLRPLDVTATRLDDLARRAGGSPLRLRRVARAVHESRRRTGALSLDDSVTAAAWAETAEIDAGHLDEAAASVLRALAVIERPAALDEIRAATELRRAEAGRALRVLRDLELVVRLRAGRRTLYFIGHPETRERLVVTVPEATARSMHLRIVDLLRAAPRSDLTMRENVAHHLIAAGCLREARRAARGAASALRDRGDVDGAIRLLTRAAREESDARCRLLFLDEVSALHHEAGDHDEGVATLEPFLPIADATIGRAGRVRVRRRLAVHYHHAGRIDDAVRSFEEVRALADPRRDALELIVVDSELAELHTLRGEYADAEDACRRGLDGLVRLRGVDEEFRARMELMLRASRGHLELRRMRFESAKGHLEAAAEIARRAATTATRALILNNLGIAHNHSNDLVGARRCYEEAGELLSRSGERGVSILISANLATIAAKRGEAAEARALIARAGELVERYPGKRLEFSVRLSRGMVAHLLGDLSSARRIFADVLPLGRDLGDEQSVIFATTYLAEGEIGCGVYGPAAERLRGAADRARQLGAASLERTVLSRGLVLESLLGRERRADAVRARLDEIPRGDRSLLESWVDLFSAASHLARGEERDASALLESALAEFERVGIAAGAGLARVGLSALARRRGDVSRVLGWMRKIGAESRTPHRFLAVLEPLERAEGALLLGQLDDCERYVREASDAIVGLPFLELDWRIEFLRARLSERRGDREGARHYLHRAIHTRDLIAHSVPPRSREAFLGQSRFASLDGLASRLERPAPTAVSSTGDAGTSPAPARHGMIGRSSAMVAVFDTIDRLRDQDVPVLIRGATGTGKELVARALHQAGSRRDGPFFALHCASLATELFESELFGYEAGAFTGAEETRPGLLESLSGGTLLLDEIGSLSPECQSKLLRVLDTGTTRRLGDSVTRPVDVRVLSSTSAAISTTGSSRAGGLRRDLYYRLARIELEVPPLAGREGDLPGLIEHFLSGHAKRLGRPVPHVSSDAMTRLESYDWPGNVRQLETVALRLLLSSSPGAVIDARRVAAVLPARDRPRVVPTALLESCSLDDLRRDLEAEYLLHHFERTGGDLPAMAASLDVNLATLYRWFRRLDLDVRALRRDED